MPPPREEDAHGALDKANAVKLAAPERGSTAEAHSGVTGASVASSPQHRNLFASLPSPPRAEHMWGARFGRNATVSLRHPQRRRLGPSCLSPPPLSTPSPPRSTPLQGKRTHRAHRNPPQSATWEWMGGQPWAPPCCREIASMSRANGPSEPGNPDPGRKNASKRRGPPRLKPSRSLASPNTGANRN